MNIRVQRLLLFLARDSLIPHLTGGKSISLFFFSAPSAQTSSEARQLADDLPAVTLVALFCNLIPN